MFARLVLFALLAPCLSADTLWKRSSAPPFTLYADSGIEGLPLLNELTVLDRYFTRLTGRSQPSERPVQIIVFGAEGDFRRYSNETPGRVGYYLRAPDRDFLVMTSARGELRHVAYHEFAHLAVMRSVGVLPPWLEEGLAEYYSTLRFDRGSARIGAPIKNHLALLRHASWLKPAELFTAGPRSHAEEAKRGSMFYAQSWALVHMLRNHKNYRDFWPEMIAQAGRGVPAGLLLQDLADRQPAQVWSDLSAYLSQPVLPTEREPLPPMTAGTPDGQIPKENSVPVSESEKSLLLAELLRELGHPDRAHEELSRTARRRPGSPEMLLALAEDALARGDKAEARRLYREAANAGTADARALFELSVLDREAGQPVEEWRPLLEKALRQNPGLAEAAYLLGQEALLDQHSEAAVEYFETAVAARPDRPDLLLHLGRAHLEAGNRAAAAEALERARTAAYSQADRAQADALANLLNHPSPSPAPPAGPKQDVIVPDTWREPVGDEVAEGSLQEFECLNGKARLRLDTPAGPLRLLIRDPRKIRINSGGAEKTTFACGAQDGVKVRIEYQAQPDEQFHTEGDVTAIELQNK